MKISYNSLISIYEFLRSDNWQDPLNNNIQKIKNDIEQLSNNKDKIKDYDQILNTKKTEIERTEKNIKDKVYDLKFHPFNNNLKIAGLLSTKMDLFLEERLNFNQDTLLSVQNMLRQNFDYVYKANKDEISKRVSIKKAFTPMQSDKSLNHLLNKPKISYKDLGIQELKNIEPNQLLAKEILKKAYFLSFFGHNDDMLKTLVSHSITFFDKNEYIDKFLQNLHELGLSGLIEPNKEALLKFANLSQESQKIWQSINAKLLLKGIQLFKKAACLNLDEKIAEIWNNSEKNIDKTIASLEKQINNLLPNEKQLELLQYFVKYDINFINFQSGLDLLKKPKTHDELPDFKFSFKFGEETYGFSKLPIGDIRALVMGKIANCCRSLGESAKNSAINSFTRPDATVYIVTNEDGKILASLYAWIANNGALVLNSFESLAEGKKLFIPLMKELLGRTNEYELKELYIGSGGATPKLQGAEIIEDIKPKNPGVDSYNDVKSSYIITKDTLEKNSISLKGCQNSDDEFNYTYPTFKNLDDLLEHDELFITQKLPTLLGKDLFAKMNHDKPSALILPIIFKLGQHQSLYVEKFLNLSKPLQRILSYNKDKFKAVLSFLDIDNKNINPTLLQKVLSVSEKLLNYCGVKNLMTFMSKYDVDFDKCEEDLFYAKNLDENIINLIKQVVEKVNSGNYLNSNVKEVFYDLHGSDWAKVAIVGIEKLLEISDYRIHLDLLHNCKVPVIGGPLEMSE